MHGEDERTSHLSSYLSPEQRVPADHPLRLAYNLLFRRFVGLGMDDMVWALTTFTKNPDRLLDGDIA